MADHLDAVLAQRLSSRAYHTLNRVCLGQRVKYVRPIQRKASSPHAQGKRYFVQLALEGVPFHKPKHTVGTDTIGTDLGPTSIALVPREGEASLAVFREELSPDTRAIRRLQRKMHRQRRAANPDHYDGRGRIKKAGKQRLYWRTSKGYERTRQRKAEKERKLAAHRKSLHGKKVHEIIAVGTTIILEKISSKAWRKQFGPVQRDLYSAFLASTLDQAYLIPSCARAVNPWEGAEARLRAAHERVVQRANEGQFLPRSFGVPRAGARRPQSLSETTQGPALLARRGRLEAWRRRSEPPLLQHGGRQEKAFNPVIA